MYQKKVDWAKLLNMHSSKSIWVIKLSFCQKIPHGRIISAKGQSDQSYSFWTMPIYIFSPVYFFLVHTLLLLYVISSSMHWYTLSNLYYLIISVPFRPLLRIWPVANFLAIWVLLALRTKAFWNIEPDSLPIYIFSNCNPASRVSVQGVESLWGDCRFIPADWGS